MKIVLVLCLMVAVVSAAPKFWGDSCGTFTEHDLDEGCDLSNAGDGILLRKQILVPGRFLMIQKHTMKFPESGPGIEVINCIRVRDMNGNGKGGCPMVLNGGVGFHDVTLEFDSQRGQDMKFSVEIYGR